jgi:hypothetical protein
MQSKNMQSCWVFGDGIFHLALRGFWALSIGSVTKIRKSNILELDCICPWMKRCGGSTHLGPMGRTVNLKAQRSF